MRDFWASKTLKRLDLLFGVSSLAPVSRREASHKPQGFSPWMKAQKQKRINLYSVKGAWRLDQGKIIALAFSLAAEIERDLISQRTKEALRFKKAQGMKLGRPTAPAKRKLDPYRPEIENLLA